MPNAGAACPAAETTVGDQGNLVAESLSHDRGRGRKHLLHPGSALWTFVAHDDAISRLDFASQDARHGILLGLEDHGGTFELHHGCTDAANFHRSPFRSEIAK